MNHWGCARARLLVIILVTSYERYTVLPRRIWSLLCVARYRACSCRRNRVVWKTRLFCAVNTSTPLLMMCTGFICCLMFIMIDGGGVLLTRIYCTRRKQHLPRKWKIPKTHRFLFFFLESTGRIDSCARARGFPSKNKTSAVLLGIKRVILHHLGIILFVHAPQGCCIGGRVQVASMVMEKV